VPFDLGHFAHRFIEPFNSESRFYWPAVIALGILPNSLYEWALRAAAPLIH